MVCTPALAQIWNCWAIDFDIYPLTVHPYLCHQTGENYPEFRTDAENGESLKSSSDKLIASNELRGCLAGFPRSNNGLSILLLDTFIRAGHHLEFPIMPRKAQSNFTRRRRKLWSLIIKPSGSGCGTWSCPYKLTMAPQKWHWGPE